MTVSALGSFEDEAQSSRIATTSTTTLQHASQWKIPGIDCDLYDTLYGTISGIASIPAAVRVATASTRWMTNGNTSATMDSILVSPHTKSPTLSCISTSSSNDNSNDTNSAGEVSMMPAMTMEEAQVGTQAQQKRGEQLQKHHPQQQMMGEISASVNDIHCGETFHGARRAYVGIRARPVGKQRISPFHLRGHGLDRASGVSAMSGGLTDPFLSRSGRLGNPFMNDMEVVQMNYIIIHCMLIIYLLECLVWVVQLVDIVVYSLDQVLV